MLASIAVPEILTCSNEDRESMETEDKIPEELSETFDLLSDKFNMMTDYMDDYILKIEHNTENLRKSLRITKKLLRLSFDGIAKSINENNKYKIWFDDIYLFKIKISTLEYERVKFNKEEDIDGFEWNYLETVIDKFLLTIPKTININKYHAEYETDYMYLFLVVFNVLCDGEPIAIIYPKAYDE